MKKNILLTFGVMLSILNICKSQSVENYFRSPVDIPIYLSGNFGELRTGHYHSGLDIKTQGVEGKKIYATASGYVSRVKISPFGYGKALYIDHPNGYTTVYAHLKKFMPKVDSVISRLQYENESFAIDTMLSVDRIRITKGEVIALSGNSGSSGGPHLHFEIRKTDTEEPVNPLLWGIPVADTKVPRIRRMYIYPLEASALVNGKNKRLMVKVSWAKGKYSIAQNISVSGRVGFAFDTKDYMSYTRNSYGVYDFKLKVDGSLKHHFTFDKISFEDNKYYNAHIDYALNEQSRVRIHKGFHEQNHKESFIRTMNDGVVFADNKKHRVDLEVKDVRGNKSSLSFEVQGVGKTSKDNQTVNFPCSTKNRISKGSFLMNIPAYALYQDYAKLNILEQKSSMKTVCSSQYVLKGRQIALSRRMRVGIKPKVLLQKDKMYIAQRKRNKYKYIGNEWRGDTLWASSKSISAFVVLKDTTPPSIVRLRKYTKYPLVKFQIKDLQSGITSYRATVNGAWQPFDYDAKRDIYSFNLKKSKGAGGYPYLIKIEVVDKCGNRTEKEFKI